MPTPTTMRTVSRDKALTAHLSQVFNYMAGGVGISGIVAYLAFTNPAVMEIALKGSLLWLLGVFAMAFFFQRAVFSMQPAAGLALFAGFSAMMGMALAPFALLYTGSSIATAFGIAAVMFAGTAAYGYFTQKSLSTWGTFIIMGIWGIVGFSLITLLVQLFGGNVGPMNTVINLIAVPLFAGATAWQVNTIKESFSFYGRDELMRSRLAILQATSLYINFINIFTSLLQLTGSRR